MHFRIGLGLGFRLGLGLGLVLRCESALVPNIYTGTSFSCHFRVSCALAAQYLFTSRSFFNFNSSSLSGSVVKAASTCQVIYIYI